MGLTHMYYILTKSVASQLVWPWYLFYLFQAIQLQLSKQIPSQALHPLYRIYEWNITSWLTFLCCACILFYSCDLIVILLLPDKLFLSMSISSLHALIELMGFQLPKLLTSALAALFCTFMTQSMPTHYQACYLGQQLLLGKKSFTARNWGSWEDYFLNLFMHRKREATHPVTVKVFLNLSPDTAMLFAAPTHMRPPASLRHFYSQRTYLQMTLLHHKLKI